MFQDLTSLVVDLGSATSKIGYGGDDAPRLTPASYVSHYDSAMISEDHSAYHIGDKQLWNERPDNNILSIYQHKGHEGYRFNYQILQSYLSHHLINQLGADLKDYSVLLSEDIAAKPAENKQFREKTAQFLFQKLGVANVFYLKAPVLSCFATGRSTALVLDSGQNFTRSVAVHQGFCLLKSARVSAYGGHNLSKDIERFLAEKLGRSPANKYQLSGKNHSQSFLNFHQNLLIKDVKQALSVRKHEESGGDTLQPFVEYELPDRQTITIDRKEIREGFIYGDQEDNFKGAPLMVTQTVNMCDVDVKKQLYSNILLTGGNVLYGSYAEDVLAKVGESSPANIKVKGVSVCAASERRFLSWLGGSIVTSLSSFQSYWLGSQEWKECGSVILQKKCN